MSQLNLSNDELVELLASAIEVHNPEWAETTRLQTAVMLSPLYTQNHLIVEPPFGAKEYTLTVSLSWKVDPVEMVATDDPNWVYNWQIKAQLRIVPNEELSAEDGLEMYNHLQQALTEINPVAWWPAAVANEHMGEGHTAVFRGPRSQAVIETKDTYPVLSKIVYELDAGLEIPVPEDDTAVFAPVLSQLAQFFGLLERFIVDLSEATHSIEI